MSKNNKFLSYKMQDLIWYKKPRFTYYLSVFGRGLIPVFLCRLGLERKLSRLKSAKNSHVLERVNYYNKLSGTVALDASAASWSELKLPERQRTYYFDMVRYLRCFPKKLRAEFLFGDITHVPETPAFTKSRPVSGNNANSVLMKLNRFRHFQFIKDRVPFDEKMNMLVGRSHASQEHRIRFLEMYFGNPLCNLGQINRNENSNKWQVGRLTIAEHLQYKFILCLEGNDVATNLKWVMSSNSLAVMPKPSYESWYMEGTLIPNFHYVEIKSDFSDLEERLTYYTEHPDEAQKIVANAQRYTRQFRNKRVEGLISLAVIEKYFQVTGQSVRW